MLYKINPMLFILSFVIASCSPSEADIATAISKTQVASESIKPTSGQDICEWFLMTQFLRTRRLSGLNELTQWMLTHDLYALDEVTQKEFVEILVRYQPFQEEFVLEWKELGPHPNAVVFWEKELESIELRIEAIDEMGQGVENYDPALYAHGWDLFIESQQVGHESETAMLGVRSKCVN